jgi:hypothetical protein
MANFVDKFMKVVEGRGLGDFFASAVYGSRRLPSTGT